jgi:branched-chain amino acid aminotransferase
MATAGASQPIQSSPNVVFLNGKFVPAAEARVSVFDRAFTYGDGIFETLRVYGGKPFAWELHLARWNRAAEFLRLKCPVPENELLIAALRLIDEGGLKDCALRIQLSRGVGPRGFLSAGANAPVVVMSVHPAPKPKQSLRLITSSFGLPPLSHLKTCNRLVHVLARDEAAEKGADDAIFLNAQGMVAETTAANIFWLEGNTLCTPALSTGCLPGVTRQLLLELWGRSPKAELEGPLERLLASDGAFLSNSMIGVADVNEINGTAMPTSCTITDLQEAYILKTGSG